jgi:hypothetical protein
MKDEIPLIEKKLEEPKESNPCKLFLAFSAGFSMDFFWMLINELMASYLQRTIKTNLVEDAIIWNFMTIAGVICGAVIPNYLTRSTERPVQRIVRSCTLMAVCAVLTIGFFAMFFSTPQLLYSIFHYDDRNGIVWASGASFALLMLFINSYMHGLFIIVNPLWKSKSGLAVPVSAAWGAAGQIAAMLIVGRLFEDPLRDVLQIVEIFGMFLMTTTIILLMAIYLRNPRTCSCSEEEASSDRELDEIDCSCCCRAISQLCYDDGICCFPCLLGRHCKSYFNDGGLIIWLIHIFSWISLFYFLPVTLDWFTLDVYLPNAKTETYNDGLKYASMIRIVQPSAQLIGSLFQSVTAILLKKLQKKKKIPPTPKTRFIETWVFIVLGLALYSFGLFMAAFKTDITWAIIAITLSGLGVLVIIPFRGFQVFYFEAKEYHNGKGLTEEESDEKSQNYLGLFNAFIILGQCIANLTRDVIIQSPRFGYKGLFIFAGASSSLSLILVILTLCLSKACQKRAYRGDGGHIPQVDSTAPDHTLFKRTTRINRRITFKSKNN